MYIDKMFQVKRDFLKQDIPSEVRVQRSSYRGGGGGGRLWARRFSPARLAERPIAVFDG